MGLLINKRISSLLLLAAILCRATLAHAQTTRPVARELAVVQRIIRQLDDPDPDIRKAASLQLNSLGAGALGAIDAALKDENLSAEARARLAVAGTFVRPRAALQLAGRARIDWESKALRDAYSRSGNTDPKSDALANAAIDLFVQLPVNPKTAAPDARDKLLAAFAAAVKAGADDPLILGLYGIAYGQPAGMHMGPLSEDLSHVMFKLVRENYPPAVKLRVLAGFLRYDKDGARVLAFAAIEQMKQLAGQKDIPPLELNVIGDMMYDSGQISNELDGKWEDFLKAFEKASPGQSGPMVERARALMQDAWDTRNAHMNNGDLTERREKEYADSLSQAAQLLDAAWKLDPTSSWPCRNMVRLKMLQGAIQNTPQNRQDMEMWYDRAMTANPDDRACCNFKLQFLSPDWHGDFDQMITFGRDCLRTENWRGGIPMVLVAAHEAAANGSDDRAVYFEEPQVWSDIRDVYEGAVLNFPANLQYRCEFAKYATQCGKWDVADAQFKVIGDKPLISVFGSESSYNYLRKKATRLAADKGGEESKPPVQ